MTGWGAAQRGERAADADAGETLILAAESGESLADQLVSALAAEGIVTYFGVPGGAIESLFDALARYQRAGRVTLVPMRSEAGTAFAADGYHRATGGISACVATSGPGISNLLTAVMSAHADRIPLLALTPQVSLCKQGRGALQESSEDGYDLTRILAACTRYSSTVTHPLQLPHKLARALASARGAPGGPVHLSIPSDVLAGRAIQAANDGGVIGHRGVSAAVDHGALTALSGDLRVAASPVLYVGDDAGPTAHRLFDLAHRTGGTVVASPGGKRWVGHLDSAYRGVSGFSGHASARAAMGAADLIVTFGATFDELSTNAWRTFSKVPVYAVDRHAMHAHRLPHARPVIADVALAIDWIGRAAHGTGGALRRRRIATVPQIVHSSGDGPVHPADLMRWLGDELPEDVVVHVDAGNSFSWSTRDLNRTLPDTYRVAMGLSSMGWALAASVGAAVASGRRTVCVSGDGAMLMASNDLTVAVERNLPVTYVVLNDAGLGMVRHGQRLSGAESIAHAIAPVRFDQIAQACGAFGIRVAGLADLASVPREWLESDAGGPCLIDVQIDRDAVPPMADRVLGLATGVPK